VPQLSRETLRGQLTIFPKDQHRFVSDLLDSLLLRSDVSEDYASPGTPGSGVIDHGSLAGLTDDDHTHYLTTGRHDLVARHGVAVGGTGANMSATGPGYVKQASAGSVFTTSYIAASDVTSGTFVSDRLATGTDDANDIIVADGAGSQAWQAPGEVDFYTEAGVQDTIPLTAPAGGGGSGGAPTDAQYVTLATSTGLSDERVLTAGNGITLTDGGAGTTVTVATSIGKWDVDATPASPHAKDDEFSNSAISADWTAFDPGTAGPTWTEEDYGLLGLLPASGSKWCGYFKTVPSGTWKVQAKVWLGSGNAANTRIGIAACQDFTSNPTTSDFEVGYIQSTATGIAVVIDSWSKYDTLSASRANNTPTHLYPCPASIYLQLSWSGTVTRLDYSLNGNDWIFVGQNATAYTPAEFAIIAFNSQASIRQVGVDFFRVTAPNTLFYPPVYGRRV